METLRKPYQGLWNVIRFNWHFYILSIAFVIILLTLPLLQETISSSYLILLACFVFLVTCNSLLVSFYIYDLSPLYTLTWLDELCLNQQKTILNINAGFDETSVLLQKKFPNTELRVLDFYDPDKHTEVSIKRARKAYPPFTNTIAINTDHIPLEDNSVDTIYAILSVHEIRNVTERISFFTELKRVLKPKGKLIITEHLRDFPNFTAYTIGFFHFHSKKTWLNTFKKASFVVHKEIKITPFLTTFVLQNA